MPGLDRRPRTRAASLQSPDLPRGSLMRSLRCLLAAGALLAFLPPAGAQTLPGGFIRGPAMGGISEYRLPNGLKLLLIPDASQDTTTVNVTYLVGSRHEGYGETRNGAPARAHAVQGHADASRIRRASSRNAARATTARPRSTAPTTSRRSRPATRRSSTSSISKPTGWRMPRCRRRISRPR